MTEESVEPWSREAAYARLLRLQPAVPIAIRSEPIFMESNSNDAWAIGDAVLRVCWRGDRGRFVREARIVAALPPSIPHATLLGFGSFEDLTWTLHERVVGDVLDAAWLDLPEPTLRQIIAQFASILAALHDWTPPADVDLILADHERVVPHSTEAIVDAALIPLPVPRLLSLVEAARELEFVDPSVVTQIGNRVRELASADPFTTSWPHIVHGDAVFLNVLVYEG